MASLISQLVSPAGRLHKQHSILRVPTASSSSSYHPTSGNNLNASALLGPLNIISTPKQLWTTSPTRPVDFDRFRLLEAHNSTSSSTGGEGSDEAKVGTSSWIDLYLPMAARPYAQLARLHKPIGIWLFAWPCMWAIGLAARPGQLPDIKMLTLFAFLSLFIRSIACTINDIFDRDFDAKVERTKSRPLASGALSPIQGILFLGFQMLLGFGILLQLNNYSRVLGALWLLPIFTYPLLKRFTYWPQAYLGFMISWGALLGWAAVKGSTEPAILFPLYISGACWTLVYDTIYAHQDKEDDQRVGVKSTALKFGDSTKRWLTGFAIMCIASLAVCGYNAAMGLSFYAVLPFASAHLAWQIWTADLSSPLDCNRKFVSNKWFGAIIFIGILLGRLSS